MKKVLSALSFLIIGYIFIPNIYHFFKLKNTNENEILKNRELYNKLAIDLQNNNDSKKYGFLS